MGIVTSITTYLEHLATKIPLEAFCVFGALIEEIIAPIPSPLVMTLCGSIASAQSRPMIYLLWIAILGAVGRVFGAWFLYIVADKAEDLVLTKFGKFIGITHKEVEKLGSYFNGGWKDDLTLFILRCIPVMPSSPISITCGVIKINKRTFLTATFAGTIIRDLFFMYLGYTGLAASKSLMQGIENLETIFKILTLVGIGGALFWAYRKREQEGFFTKIVKFFTGR